MTREEQTLEALTKRIEELEKDYSDFKKTTTECVIKAAELISVAGEIISLYADDYDKKFGLSYDNKKRLKQLERKLGIYESNSKKF